MEERNMNFFFEIGFLMEEGNINVFLRILLFFVFYRHMYIVNIDVGKRNVFTVIN